MVYDKSLVAQAVALYRKGEPTLRICRKLGIATDTLYRWLEREGIKNNRKIGSGVTNLDYHSKKLADKLAVYAVYNDKHGDKTREEFEAEFLKEFRSCYEFRTGRKTEKSKAEVHREEVALNEVVEQAKQNQVKLAEKMAAKDPLDEPKQPRTLIGDGTSFMEAIEAARQEAERKLGPAHRAELQRISEEYAQVWHVDLKGQMPKVEFPEAEPPKREIVNYTEFRDGTVRVDYSDGTHENELPEGLIDIEAEDAKNICAMCGNMLNTEFCCKWEG